MSIKIIETLSKFFVYLAVLSPVIVLNDLYFPFITGKALFFRFVIEAALLLYLLYILFLKDPLRKNELNDAKEAIKNPIFISVSIFALLIVVSSLASPNLHLSFWSNFERSEGAFQMLHYFGFFALLAILFRKKSDWLGIFKFNLAAAVLASLYAIAQLANYYGWIHWDWVIFGGPRPGGTLGNPAYLGGYMLLAIFSGLFLISNAKTKINKLIYGTASVFLFLMIFMSNTRGALLALGAGIFILLAYLSFKRLEIKPIYKNLPLITLSAVLIFGTVFLATPNLPLWKEVPGLQRLTIQSMFGGGSFYTRLWTWGSAMSGIIERPVLGWGVENFTLPFDKYYNPHHFGSDTWYDRTHNVFLDYAVNGGLLLLFAYLSIFFLAFKKAIRSQEIWPKIIAVWLIMYLIQGMVLFDVLTIYIQLFILLAFFVWQTRIDTNTNTNKHEAIIRTSNVYNIVKYAAIGIITIAFAASYYYGIYLPYKKNIAVINSIGNAKADIANWQKYFKSSLNFYSPIGQQENIEQFYRFWNDALEFASSKNQTITNEAAFYISDFSSLLYEKNKQLFSSTRPLLLLGIINMRLGVMSGGEEFIKRAENYCVEGNGIAPSRIEFLLCLKNAAEAFRDEEKLKTINAKLNFLRPDLYSPSGEK